MIADMTREGEWLVFYLVWNPTLVVGFLAWWMPVNLALYLIFLLVVNSKEGYILTEKTVRLRRLLLSTIFTIPVALILLFLVVTAEIRAKKNG